MKRLPANSGRLTGNLALHFTHGGGKTPYSVEIVDNAYGSKAAAQGCGGRQWSGRRHSGYAEELRLDDVSVKVRGFPHFEKRYAGHVETGNASYSDPFMGGVVLAKQV